MKGILFGNYHSYDDFGLILSSKEIGSPEPKIVTIDVEGGDGVLDFTEFAGETKFKSRSLTFHFSKTNVLDNFMTLFSQVHNALHGKKMNIILDEDPGFYYVGRITVDEFKADANIGKITVECDCEPYKIETSETVVSKYVDGSATFSLNNNKKRVVPTITTDSEMIFKFEGIYYTEPMTGTFTIPEIELKEGVNTIDVSGVGNVTFRFRKGML